MANDFQKNGNNQSKTNLNNNTQKPGQGSSNLNNNKSGTNNSNPMGGKRDNNQDRK